MSSTYADAGVRAGGFRVVPGRQEREEGAGSRPAVAAREKRPAGRAHLGQALTLSLALLALVTAGALVVVPIVASGSARPSDWGRVNWGLVAGRYQVCANGKQGLGALGCLSAIGPRATLSTVSAKRGVVYVTTPIQEAAPPAVAPAAPPARSSAPPSAGAPAQSPATPVRAASPPPITATPATGTGGGDE
jgi:hypothetical protein